MDDNSRAGLIEAATVGTTTGDDAMDTQEAMLGLATTRELLTELSVRMKVTQNSTKGRDLGRLCEEAIENLAPYVLDYRTVGPYPEPDPDEPTEPDVV